MPARRARGASRARRARCAGGGGGLGLAVAGQVLVQRAAAGDVERLGAAADAEDRQPARVGGARQLELEGVEPRLGRPELVVALAGAVGVGIEVRAAGQADAVEPVESVAASPSGGSTTGTPPAASIARR